MKSLVCIIATCLALLPGRVSSQGSAEAKPEIYLHSVYRLDGSVLIGEIMEWNSEELRLKLLSGVELRIPAASISKVISNTRSNGSFKRRGVFEREYRFKNEGMYHVTTTSFSAGPYAAAGVTHTVGYRFSRLLGVGVGSGIESFDLGSGNQIVPLFAEARGFFLPQNITPYYAVRAGYGFALKNEETNVTDANGGRMLSFELGYRFGGARAVNFFTGIGMHFQNAQYRYAWPWSETITDNIKYRRTELRLGVIF